MDNLYFVSFISGLICWLLDQLCRTQFGTGLEPYQMHAWWHFFYSISNWIWLHGAVELNPVHIGIKAFFFIRSIVRPFTLFAV